MPKICSAIVQYLSTVGFVLQVDMLVRDIYGGDYKDLGLPGDLIASSFGKAASPNAGTVIVLSDPVTYL